MRSTLKRKDLDFIVGIEINVRFFDKIVKGKIYKRPLGLSMTDYCFLYRTEDNKIAEFDIYTEEEKRYLKRKGMDNMISRISKNNLYSIHASSDSYSRKRKPQLFRRYSRFLDQGYLPLKFKE